MTIGQCVERRRVIRHGEMRELVDQHGIEDPRWRHSEPIGQSDHPALR